MKREYRLRDMIKEGILDIFYIWKDELKNVFKDEGVLIFFFLVPFAYPLLYSFIYNNEVVREAKMVVVDQSDSYLSREFTRRVNATPDVRVVAVSTDMDCVVIEDLRQRKMEAINPTCKRNNKRKSWENASNVKNRA